MQCPPTFSTVTTGSQHCPGPTSEEREVWCPEVVPRCGGVDRGRVAPATPTHPPHIYTVSSHHASPCRNEVRKAKTSNGLRGSEEGQRDEPKRAWDWSRGWPGVKSEPTFCYLPIISSVSPFIVVLLSRHSILQYFFLRHNPSGSLPLQPTPVALCSRPGPVQRQ